MSDRTHKRIDEMEAIFGGSFKRARASLGITAFGLAVLDLPPGFDRVPAHAHTFDQQEEVYLPLAGGGWLEIDGERRAVDPETLVRVGPRALRRPIAGPQGMRLLVIGAAPGRAYEPFPLSVAGSPEPAIGELPGMKAAADLAGAEASHDFTLRRLADMESMRGFFQGVSLTPARRELGVTAFGLNVLDLEPGDGTAHPRHDHGGDGQEEVYVPLSGSGAIEIDGERVPLSVGEMIRVGPHAVRQLLPGPEGLRVLAIGGTPGKAYEPARR